MSNIRLIADALQEYNDYGCTTIDNELADYVLIVLKGLKCSFDVEVDKHTFTTTIKDRMSEL